MKFYRYDQINYEYEAEVKLNEYALLKETPCGYWILSDPIYYHVISKPMFADGNKRWISKTARKRFAYPTKAEALNSFKIRKERQIGILSGQLENAKEALQKANDIVLEE